MYEIFEKLCQERGVNASGVCRDTGIQKNTISQWKTGKTNLKADKLKKLADYFGVSIDYLMTGEGSEKESTSGKKYYFSDETAEMAQKLFENKDLRLLFDASR